MLNVEKLPAPQPMLRGKELLLAVKEAILEEGGQRLNMGCWKSKTNEFSAQKPACQTVCCFAGWANVISANSREHQGNFIDIFQGGLTIEYRARDFLALSNFDARNLFYTEDWLVGDDDRNFRIEYEEAREHREYLKAAQIAADYIDYFISRVYPSAA